MNKPPGNNNAPVVQALAEEVQAAASADPDLCTMLERLITQAQESKRLAGVIAVARDNARQVNIGGDNSGNITM
jgi:hypothetical protein